jgi:hypothetical protein
MRIGVKGFFSQFMLGVVHFVFISVTTLFRSLPL